MTKRYNNPDGSVTIGPAERHRDLVSALETYAALRKDVAGGAEECRRLAWFLGDVGEREAAEAIMKHAKVIEPMWNYTPWGYVPIT